MLNTSDTYRPSRLALTLVVVCWIVFGAFHLLFPGFTTGNLIALYVISGVVIAGIGYTPFAGRAATAVMGCTVLLLGVGVILNTWYFTTYLGGTPDAPVLFNYDEARWWNGAMWAAGHDTTVEPTQHLFFCHLLGAVLYVFGPSIGAALLTSLVLSSISLILCGLTAYRLTSDRKTAVIAMICTAAVCYWLAMGTLLLKEPLIITAMALGAYGLVSRARTMAICVAGAALLLGAARPNYIFMLIIGIAVVPALKSHVWLRIALTIFAIAVWLLADSMLYNPDVEIVVSADSRTAIRYDAPNQMALSSMIGDYSALPWYNKIVLLPVTALVQFLIPFPWNFMRDVPFGVTQVWAHIAYPWYLFGLFFVYGLFKAAKTRGNMLIRQTLWGMAMWLLPCYMFSGTISRYGLPAVIILAPLVAVTVLNEYKKRGFYIYLGISAVILMVGLVICHHLQSSYTQ